jgi:hypothetical protein
MMSTTDEELEPEPDFITLGRFEPPDAKRILKRLQEQHIPFRVDAPGEVHPDPTPYRIRRHWLVIYVHPTDVEKAGEIVSAGNRI